MVAASYNNLSKDEWLIHYLIPRQIIIVTGIMDIPWWCDMIEYNCTYHPKLVICNFIRPCVCAFNYTMVITNFEPTDMTSHFCSLQSDRCLYSSERSLLLEHQSLYIIQRSFLLCALFGVFFIGSSTVPSHITSHIRVCTISIHSIITSDPCL